MSEPAGSCNGAGPVVTSFRTPDYSYYGWTIRTLDVSYYRRSIRTTVVWYYGPFVPRTVYQDCSLGLERLGLETVSRHFFERLGLVSILSLQHLGLVTPTSRSHLISVSRL